MRRIYSLPIEIGSYKKDIDRTLLRENLRRTVDERVAQLIAMSRSMESRRAENEDKEDKENP